MAVKIEKTFQVSEPIDKVWAFLSDPNKVVVCVPGAKITEQVDATHYKGAISVKVGPSLTEYKGDVEIVRKDDAAHQIEILGKGQDVRGRGSASMKMTGKLRAIDAANTEVVSESELNIVGILAQMGARVIQEVSNIMFEQFTTAFRERLQGGVPTDGAIAAPKAISGLGLAFSALKATITGHSGETSSEAEKPKGEAGKT